MRYYSIIFAAICWQCCSAEDLIVQVADGKVRGTALNDSSGREFYAWRRIPFAKPPLGELRFKAPVKPDPWNGVLDGTKDGLACIQGGSDVYSEDCLFINVYTPTKPKANLSLPVMYWIYGGGLVQGSSEYKVFGPTEILKENVIYVSANYRLGIYGFLSLEDQILPGNAGFKDQLAGIQWTKNNIAQFGGNPDDITIFGESAGAASVGFQLASPLTRNLFKAAIMESGGALGSSTFSKGARNNALKLAQSIDPKVKNTSQDILTVLQAADVATINNSSIRGFNVVLEVEEGNPTPFLPRSLHIYEAIEAGNYTKVPIIIGVNSEESLGFIDDLAKAKESAASYDANPTKLLPVMNLKSGVTKETVAQEIYKAYVGNGTFVQNISVFVNWMSQNAFLRSSIKQALLHSKHQPAYFYRFSYAGTPSSKHQVIPGCGRVAHADELSYLFDTNFNIPIKTAADHLTRRRFVKLWTNFAKYKNPTPNDTSAELLQNVKWEPMDASKLQYLDIDADLKLQTQLVADKVAFWNYLWNTYVTRPYNTF